MAKKSFSQEEIKNKLAEADVLLGNSEPIDQICTKLGISEQTYYRWREKGNAVTSNKDKRQINLEQENSRLRNLVVDLLLGNAIFK